jgi:hypothetical protein
MFEFRTTVGRKEGPVAENFPQHDDELPLNLDLELQVTRPSTILGEGSPGPVPADCSFSRLRPREHAPRELLQCDFGQWTD